MTLKHARGWLLRLVLKRPVTIGLVLAFVAPSAWLLLQDFPWETPVTDGVGLVAGATGAAFLLTGIGGRRPDWIEPD